MRRRGDGWVPGVAVAGVVLLIAAIKLAFLAGVVAVVILMVKALW